MSSSSTPPGHYRPPAVPIGWLLTTAVAGAVGVFGVWLAMHDDVLSLKLKIGEYEAQIHQLELRMGTYEGRRDNLDTRVRIIEGKRAPEQP